MSLECEGLGTTCAFHGCGTYDFLPTTCSYCRETFCAEHAERSKHHCCPGDVVEQAASAPVDFVAGRASSNEFLSCATCGAKNIFVSICSVCSEPACVAHRFQHMHDSSIENRRRVQHRGAAVRREPVLPLGPLPSGARGIELLALFVDATGLKWCHAVVGVGGSAGRVCDDASQQWPSASSAGSDQPSQCVECFVARTMQVDRRVFRGGNVGSIPMRELLDLKYVPKAELVQSFASPRDIAALVLCRSDHAPLPDASHVEQCWHRLAAGLDKDIELRRRLTRRAWSFAIASDETAPRTAAGPEPSPPAIASSSSSPPAAANPPPVDSTTEGGAQAPPYDDDAGGEPLCTVELSVASLRFATTKTAPRGLAESKSKPHRFVAIVIARPARVQPRNAFVMAYDANWSRGKLLDRVLTEAQSMVEAVPAVQSKPASTTASRWALVHLPSMEWLCCQGDATMARLCDKISDRSALLLVSMPHDVAFGSIVASVKRQLEHRQDASKVRLVQLKECSVM